MDTLIKIIKNKTLIACFGADHLAYDNWLPDGLLELLNYIDMVALEFQNPKTLSYLYPLDVNDVLVRQDKDCSVIDLDTKTVRLSRGIFQIVPLEDVEEEEQSLIQGSKPFSMLFLKEKMAHEFGLDVARQVLASMSDDAENLAYPTLLQDNLVYLRNVM